MRWISLISSGHSIQMQKNIPSFQVYVEHSPGQTAFWLTNPSKSVGFKSNKSNLSKFKKIEIISSIFSDHKDRDQIAITRKKTVRNTNTWRLNNTFLNNEQVTEEIKRKIKNSSKQMTMKTQQRKTYGIQQKQF